MYKDLERNWKINTRLQKAKIFSQFFKNPVFERGNMDIVKTLCET